MHAWLEAIAALGGDPSISSADELARRYAEAHRHYHTAAHVGAVLLAAEALAEVAGLNEHDRALLTLAACAHDVIYDRRPGDDERASAAWARAALRAAGLAAADCDRVAELVLFTADHRAPDDDVVAAVLLDADLAILGSAPADYEAYVAAVRAEYADVPDAQWRRGRADVLEHLLTATPLYRTPAARDRWERQAQLNVRRELAALRG